MDARADSWVSCMFVCARVTRAACKQKERERFCPTRNAPLNFSSPAESWIICFAPLSPSLFSSLIHARSPPPPICLSLSPSRYSLVIPHTLTFCLSLSSHLLWVSISLFHSHSLGFQSQLFLALPHALNSAVFSKWSPVTSNKFNLGTIFPVLMAELFWWLLCKDFNQIYFVLRNQIIETRKTFSTLNTYGCLLRLNFCQITVESGRRW